MERDDQFEMTFTDSDSCTSYEISSKAYPRFRYVKDRLQSFYPRFLKTVEKLPKVLKWMDLVQNIGENVQPLVENKPEVILFGPDHTLVQKDSILANKSGLEEMDCTVTIFPRTELLKHVSSSKPQVLVYTCTADQVKKVSVYLEMELSACGLDSVLLLPDVKGFKKEEAQVLLKEVFRSMSDTARDLWNSKVIVNITDQSLSTGINNILEMRLVREFQKIDRIIDELLSIRRHFQVVVFEEDYLVSSLVKGIFRNKKLVQDLMDAANNAEGGDYFIPVQKQIVHFIEMAVATQFSLEFKIATGIVHAMLEDSNFRKNCKSQVSATTSLSIENELSEIYMESQTDEDVWSKETNEGRTEKMETDEEPQTSKRKHRYKRDMSVSVERAKMLIKDLQAVLKTAELLIHSVSESLTILSQMQFEVNGVLSDTIICSEEERNILTIIEHGKVAEMVTDEQKTEDPLEFWIDKLMSLYEVQGCGDYFGKLVVFISDPSSASEMRDVFANIGKCLAGCPYDYDVKIVTMPLKTNTFADPDQEDGNRNRTGALPFKAGQKVCFQGRSGTLGLFVNDTLNQSVYFVTNGHLVSFTGTQPVNVISEDSSIMEIGRQTWNYQKDGIDIGAVKVQGNLLERCALTFEDWYGKQCPYMMLDTKKFQRVKRDGKLVGKLVGKHVLKRGAQTGLTIGVIASQTMTLKEDGIIKTYNYVISPLPNSDVDAVFAKEGDSGSVVSLRTIDTNPIFIIAMLIGGMIESRPGNAIAQDFRPNVAEIERLCLTFSLMDGIDALNNTYELNLDINS
ncbi:hypothetical protein CHS0354_011267 [Potamilus streckersoni]|uniref:Cyclic nucleotide-binding domain-containing protein n=1 Tax=Potamilus streckersoni TaxID=2493646 RepID=A0AAE0RNH4_9BIVA|nr:hypothetical protein CHS0354_011267 [Potamilus streckersoni]